MRTRLTAAVSCAAALADASMGRPGGMHAAASGIWAAARVICPWRATPHF